jgi:hypothetical protein
MNNDYGAAGMYLVSFRSAPHNVYGDVPVFMANADASHNKTPPQQFAFARTAAKATAAVSGTPTTTISMRLSAYSSPTWTWDANQGWLRSEGTTPAITDKDQRIRATNVVLVVAEHPDSGFNAQNNAPVPTYNLVGEGQALVASGGKTLAATWRKTAEDAPMQLFTADGQPALLAPGNTWIELVPKGSGSFSVS